MIIASTVTPAVFIVEPDAIAQTIVSPCSTPEQHQKRYQLISKTVDILNNSPNALAIYLDAGHSEWVKNPHDLVGPLKQSGIDKARGVAVNVSYFIATQDITRWSQQLVRELGNNKGVIIDTSRNGNGPPSAKVTGVPRWCNPPGRALGAYPNVQTGKTDIDAYLWVKNIGESDGNCGNNPSAGTFVSSQAQDLVRNQYYRN